MKILVTGSNGAVGTRLCERLLARGTQVVGTDISAQPRSEEVGKITMTVDLRDRNRTFEALPDDVDLVVHLAAHARVPQSVTNPVLARHNLEMLFNVLEFARLNRINRLIFSSSKDVYGSGSKPFLEDDMRVTECENPYAASKIAGEAFVRSYGQCYGIRHIIVRLSNVYGLYDEADRLIPIFLHRALSGEDLIVFGKDKELDFIHMDDVVDGLLLCMDRFDDVADDTLNIASGSGVPLPELARQITDTLGTKNRIVVRENQPGDVIRCTLNISRAVERLGFQPRISLKEGIARYAGHHKYRDKA